MRMRLLVSMSMLLVVLSSAAFTADINGKWRGTFEGGPGGQIVMNFTFQEEGGKVSGTMSDEFIGEAKITEGTLKGDDISFTVAGSGPMGEMKLNFKGKVASADEMKLSLAMAGGPGGPGGGPGGPGGMEVTVKRVK
ncbi:MAG TPA: hypothetical protein VLH09_11485 [Bryobacteraceae bacterium]|nr:hypothetical protein [Bryobacteraceae bacterium]